MMTKLLLNRTK